MSQKDEPPKSPPRLAPARPIQSGSDPVRPPVGSPAPIGQMPDFETIEAAVRETARGRAFLDEYKRRCLERENFRTGSEETQSILAAIDRLESVVKSQAIEMLPRQIEAKINSPKSGDISTAVHAPALVEELTALAQKLKLRGQAPDIAEKLQSIAQNLAQDQACDWTREKPDLPASSPVVFTPPEPKPDVNAALRAQNRSAFDAVLPANTSTQVPVAKAAPPPPTAPAANPPAANSPAIIPPAAPPVKAKSPAFFLPAMEITNLEDEASPPQSFKDEPDFAQSQKLPVASPPDFMTLPSTPEFYRDANKTSAPLQDYLNPEPILEMPQAAMRYESVDFASAELAIAQFDIQSLADVEKLSAEEQMALFC